MRCEPRVFLHSRLMCWVAVDRAVRLARQRSLPSPAVLWLETRDEIHRDIWKTFWNDELGHFVESHGSTEVDGAMLMMPLVRFVSARDEAVRLGRATCGTWPTATKRTVIRRIERGSKRQISSSERRVRLSKALDSHLWRA